jgi:inosine-uridine nucleoside N-ribohydrolase
MVEQRRLIIDTDPGLDDTAALLYTLACADLVRVECLTTVFGNVDVAQTTRNALAVLDVAGRPDIPVYQGAAVPLVRAATFASHIHGNDGLGGLSNQYRPSREASPGIAAERIVEAIMAAPGEITLVALAPLTNVALALRLEPRLAEAVRQIVVMGGAARVPGNITPVASANLANDPEAAAVVYSSGAPIVQAGLDVASRTLITPPYLERIAAVDSPACRLLTQVAEANRLAYTSTYGDQGGARFNDLPTVAYAIDPTLFRSEVVRVEIETAGALTSGMTVVDWRGQYGRPPNTELLLEIDAERLVETFATRLTASYPSHG